MLLFYVYHMFVGSHGGHKRMSGPLELELLVVASCYVGLGK